MDTLRYWVVLSYNTTWYQRLIHGCHPLQKYRHEEDLLPMLAWILDLLHTGTFRVDLWHVSLVVLPTFQMFDIFLFVSNFYSCLT